MIAYAISFVNLSTRIWKRNESLTDRKERAEQRSSATRFRSSSAPSWRAAFAFSSGRSTGPTSGPLGKRLRCSTGIPLPPLPEVAVPPFAPLAPLAQSSTPGFGLRIERFLGARDPHSFPAVEQQCSARPNRIEIHPHGALSASGSASHGKRSISSSRSVSGSAPA